MSRNAALLLLLPLVGACLVRDREWDGILDQDSDGVDVPTDCDPNDSTVTVPTLYRDADGDGHGDPDTARAACDLGEGWVTTFDDCDDSDPNSLPGGVEVCDQADNDCNGEVDDAVIDPSTWYQDQDGDGFGDDSVTTLSCPQPSGYAALGGDCDDEEPAAYPGAEDVCDGIDNSCDGLNDCGLALSGQQQPGEEWIKLVGEEALDGGANAGDLTGDGVVDLVVGSTSTLSGVTYLFEGPLQGGQLGIEDAKLTLSGNNDWGEMAGSGLIIEDFDGDGSLDLAVGAANGGSQNRGMVYLTLGPLSKSLKLGSATTIVELEGAQTGDQVGTALVAGEFSGDGVVDLLIGAPGIKNATFPKGTYQIGRVYLLEGPFTDSDEVDDLRLTEFTPIPDYTSTSAGLGLGQHLANIGDINGDGQQDYAIAQAYDGGTTSTELGYKLFIIADRLTGEVQLDDAARTIITANSDFEGYAPSITAAGDIDGDGTPDLAYGLPGYSSSGDVAGAAWVFAGAELASSHAAEQAPKDIAIVSVVSGFGKAESIGSSLGGPGDLDGDGLAELWVGASLHQAGSKPVGGAALFSSPLQAALTFDDAGYTFVGTTAGSPIGEDGGALPDLNGLGSPDLWVSQPGSNALYFLLTDGF